MRTSRFALIAGLAAVIMGTMHWEPRSAGFGISEALGQPSQNVAPVADAGRDRAAVLDDIIVLDASGSSDPDGDTVTLSWRFLSIPPTSSAQLDNATLVKPRFTVDAAGDYVIELVVDDGTVASLPDTVVVSTDNVAPAADAGPDRAFGVPPGTTVELDGTASTDADGDAIAYSWTLIDRPANSTEDLDDPTSPRPSFFADFDGTYEAELTVSDGLAVSAPDRVTASTGNLPPVAEAGPAETRDALTPIFFDAEGSSDPDGDPLSFRWSVLAAPAGSGIQTNDETERRSRTAYGADGTYVIQLTVTDPSGASDTDTLVLDTANVPPVANAGPDLAVAAGATVVLDGGGSSDFDGDAIGFRWALVSTPAASTASLSDPQAVRPRFTADVAGTYVARLTVFDGDGESVPDTVVISTDNVAPVADAGPDIWVPTRPSTVTLDATASFDGDLDALVSYRWAVLQAPDRSDAAPADPAAAVTTITLDKIGTYLVQLVVNDGFVDSAPDLLVLGAKGQGGTTDVNIRPLADAGQIGRLLPGTVVQLDGSGTTDANNPESLSYRWALIHTPAGSTATLSDPFIVNPTFIADLPGTYLAQLVAFDDQLHSRPAIAAVVANARPVANAGADATAFVGDTVTLDGTGSADADFDSLTYAWTLVSAPAGSTAALTDATAATPGLTLDVAGDYVIELVVNDGFEDSLSDAVTITAVAAVNDPPVADAGIDQTVSAGAGVTLNGTGSSDPEGQALTYAWTLATAPPDSAAVLTGAATATPGFIADAVGFYAFDLVVNDGLNDSLPDEVVVTVEPPPNAPPVLDPVGNRTVDLGTTLNLTLTATDVDPLSFFATPIPLPDGASLDSLTGVFTFRPNAEQVGDIALTFGVSDGLASDTESVTITVLGAPLGGVTALSGRILDANAAELGQTVPVAGATVSVLASTTISATSDVNGFFILSSVPAGEQVFDIDTSTAAVAPDGSPYAGFRESIDLIADVDNLVDRPFFLPRIDTTSLALVDPAITTTVTNAALGVTLEVDPGSARFANGTLIQLADNIELSISEVPRGLAPAPLPDFLDPGLLITIQPVGVTFNPPARITFPNLDGAAPDNEFDIWSLDPATGAFNIVGLGVVRTDGTAIDTVAGGIRAADWHASLPPQSGGDSSDNNDENEDPEKCCDQPAGSDVGLASGNLSIQHATASYRSFGQSRGVSLVYNSTTADPQPIIKSTTTISLVSAVPGTVSGQLSIGGISQGSETFLNTGGLSESINESFLQPLQFDATSLPTGIHDYGFEATSNFSASSISGSFGGKVLVNNQIESPFGSGWTIPGLRRLRPNQPGLAAAITTGNGGIMRFGLARDGSGLFGPPSAFGVGDGRADPRGMTIVDLDEDGHLDIAAGTGFSGTISVLMGDGRGRFPVLRRSVAREELNLNANAETVRAAIGDLNNDGILDAVGVSGEEADVVNGEPQGALTIHLGRGRGFFRTPVFLSTGPFGPFDAGIADFDGDGRADIASAMISLTGQAKLTVFPGDGAGGFPASQDTALPDGRPLSLAIADVNADGRPDVAVHTLSLAAGGNVVSMLLGDGAGGFTRNDTVVSGFGFTGTQETLDFGDFDGDGDLDLTVIDTTASQVLILVNDGAGQFGAPQPVPAPNPTFLVDAADFDNDGLSDLAVISSAGSGSTLSILLANEFGGFSTPLDLPLTGIAVTSMRAGDFNEDGTADLAVADFSDEIHIFLGTPEPGLKFASPAGDFSRLIGNGDGSFTRRMKNGTQEFYSPLGLQTAVVDRNGNETRYEYDGADRVIAIVDPAGLRTTFDYLGGRLSSITDPADRVTSFEHDGAGNLIRITDPDGAVRRFAYDGRRRMVSQISARGEATHYRFNSTGRMIGSDRPDGSTRGLTPRDVVGLPDRDAGFGTVTNPGPIFRPFEAVALFTDGNGNPSTYELDRFGSSKQVTDGLQRITAIERDRNGDPVGFVSPAGFISAFDYDAVGNVLQQRSAIGRPEERAITFEYEPVFNRVSLITDAADIPVRFNYDPSGNLTESINADGIRSEFAYQDAACQGQPTLVRVAVGTADEVSRSYVYDPATCRLAETADSFGSTQRMDYDTAGNVTTLTDAGNRVTRFSFDAMNRITRLVMPLNSEPAPQCGTLGVTCIDYDAAGNVSRVTDGNGNITQFVYDERDRLTLRIDPLGLPEAYTYDANDNLRSATDRRGRRIEFEYDAADQLERQILDAGMLEETIRSFGYDLDGNLTSVTDASSALAMDYDGLDRLIAVSTAGSPFQPAVDLANTYDSNGNRRTLTDPTGLTDYIYNARDLLESVLPPGLASAIAITYDDAGRRSSIVRPNGVSSTYGYNTSGRLTLVEHATGAAVLARFDYGYTTTSTRDRLTQSRSDLVVEAVLDYGYDAQDQLISATHPVPGTAAETFAQDPAGNLLRWPGQAVDATIGAGNRLLQDDRFCYDYDANGNLESRTARDLSGACTGPATAFTHDVENQLTRIDFPDGTFAAYRYDGFGRRIEKDVNGIVTRYVYDGDDILLEYDGANALRARYTHGPGIDDPLMMARDTDGDGLIGATEQFYYHADALGSVVTLTNAAGDSVRSYLYTAFGNSADEFGLLENPYTYTGREVDAESGLYYYRARYYDPAIGRFLQEDPIRFAGKDTNLYRYVRNDPVNLRDPSGLSPATCAACELAGFANCLVKAMAEALQQIMMDHLSVPGVIALGPEPIIPKNPGRPLSFVPTGVTETVQSVEGAVRSSRYATALDYGDTAASVVQNNQECEQDVKDSCSDSCDSC